ncbi:MAG: DUF3347 domain-containing protein [Saprospiraceae bacterium]
MQGWSILTHQRPKPPRIFPNLEKVDMLLLKGDAPFYWMEQLNGLQTHSQNIAATDNVEVQRKQFSFLSLGTHQRCHCFWDGQWPFVCIQYCLMAIDNKGADWLSEEEEIRNPYFGEKMMKCGSVKLN